MQALMTGHGGSEYELNSTQDPRNYLFDLQIAASAVRFSLTRCASGVLRHSVHPTDIFLSIVDHFEPSHGRADRATAIKRLDEWLIRYPAISRMHRDSSGRTPRHSFFYPWDEFESREFSSLAKMCQEGWGEVELHLHHDNDTESQLRERIRNAVSEYRLHGCLSEWPDGRAAFAFIHGNWALDNSRCSELHNYCGVNNELTVLLDEGCYADFTFPAWQYAAQPRQLNSIYYAVDDPLKPKSYDRGVSARVGCSGEGLLLIQGPLSPYVESRFGRRRFGIDDADLAASRERRFAPQRLDRWVRTGIHVSGRRDRVFIKLHCHGAADGNREALLGTDLDALFTDAETRYNDGKRFRLHYVTAREMYNVVKATEAGIDDLERAINWILPPPGAKMDKRGKETLAGGTAIS